MSLAPLSSSHLAFALPTLFLVGYKRPLQALSMPLCHLQVEAEAPVKELLLLLAQRSRHQALCLHAEALILQGRQWLQLQGVTGAEMEIRGGLVVAIGHLSPTCLLVL